MLKKHSLIKPLMCFVLGALSTLSLTPFSIYPFIICFSLAIFFILESEHKKELFIASWMFSFGWFFSGLYWIGSAFLVQSNFFYYLLPLAITALPMALSLIWVLAFFISNELGKVFGNKFIWFLFLFSIIEYFRGYFVEFPWLMPGHALASNSYFLQSFSFIGSYSMNAVFITITIIPILIYQHREKYLRTCIFLCIPIIILLFNSFWRYETRDNIKFIKNYNITLVQPNISQKEKWKKSLRKFHHENLINLSLKRKKFLNHKGRLIIWPETGFVGTYPRDKDILEDLSYKILDINKNEFLFTGAINIQDKKYYNSAFLINSKKEILKIYNKKFSVPFGEYIPFKSIFPSISPLSNFVNFTPSTNNPKFKINNDFNFLPLICYEIIFNKYIFKKVTPDTSLIINITNDAWFGKTIGPHQHLQFARIRSVEFGIPVARVANTGISAFFSPYGEKILEIKLGKRGVESSYMLEKLETTIYKRFGDGCFVIVLIYICFINALIFTNRKS